MDSYEGLPVSSVRTRNLYYSGRLEPSSGTMPSFACKTVPSLFDHAVHRRRAAPAAAVDTADMKLDAFRFSQIPNQSDWMLHSPSPHTLLLAMHLTCQRLGPRCNRVCVLCVLR